MQRSAGTSSTPSSTAIHADLVPIVQEPTGERIAGELAALVGIEDLGAAMLGQRILHGFKERFHLHRDRQPPKQYPPAERVYRRRQIDSAAA